MFKKIVFTLREKQSRSARTSFIIIDAQSVKNTDTAEHRGYGGGKRISGIKRHLAVDINGLPQAIHITTANVSDRNGASAMLALNSGHLQQVKSVLVDGGYTGSNFAADVYTNLNATVQVAKRNELHKFEVLPQRWIVERSFSWLDKCRRLWKNCERKLNSSRQMVILAFLVLLLRRFQTGSKTDLELSIPYAPTLRSSATIDSKQLVFLNLNKNLAAVFVFKGLIFRF